MFKKIVSIIMAMAILLSLIGCGESASEVKSSLSAEITSKAIDEFISITKVPRPSYHLEHILEYLINFAKEHSFDYARDDYGNFWMDVPASSGYENAPKVILQGHMDMVCAAESDYDIDFENTGLNAKVDGNTITADKTSLGADDGIGVGIILAMVTSDAPHGPIRALITADEDVGLLGAQQLPAEALDADYLINIDHEKPMEIVYSSAGNLRWEATKEYGTKAQADGSEIIKISISGLQGGHSGLEINKNRLSANTVIKDLFNATKNEGIDFEIGSINGGTAQNAIAPQGEVIIAVPKEKSSKVKEISDKLISDYHSNYPDEKLEINVSTEDVKCSNFISNKDSLELLEVISSLPQGVLAMSQKNEGLVQTSANTGIIFVENGKCKIGQSTRSCVTKDMEDLRLKSDTMLKEKGYVCKIEADYPGWDGDADVSLVKLIKEGYEKSDSGEAAVIPIHAGLECSWFSRKREGIQMVSIGPRVDNAHTVQETLYIDTIEPCVKTVLYALKNIESFTMGK